MSKFQQIGYLRSNTLSKVSGLVEEHPLTHLSVSRSIADSERQKTEYVWDCCTMEGRLCLDINWNWHKHRTPYSKVVEVMNSYMKRYKFDDFVINSMEVAIEDSKLVSTINKFTGHKFKPETTFYFTFVNRPLFSDILNGWDAEIVRKINEHAITQLKFKRGVLDLKHVTTHEESLYYDKILGYKEVIYSVLSHLSTKKWFNLPEIEAITEETGEKPYPGVIRTYEQVKGDRWMFVGEEEVRNQ